MCVSMRLLSRSRAARRAIHVSVCHVIVFKFVESLFPPAFGLRQCALPEFGTRGRKIGELCVPRVLGYIPKAPLTHESFIFTRDAWDLPLTSEWDG